MEVPELVRRRQVSALSPCASAMADIMNDPGVVISGLILPSNVGPLELNPAIVSGGL